MFLTLDESNCPLCGTKSEQNETIPEVKNCPKCGAVFSKFGLILAFEEGMNFEWN